MTVGFVASAPEPDTEYQLAHRILGARNTLDRAILEQLVGRPRRYSELKDLLRGKRDNNLTMALDRLRRDGLADQRIDTRDGSVVKAYELTSLGILTVLRMHEMIPAYISAQTLLRGQIVPA